MSDISKDVAMDRLAAIVKLLNCDMCMDLGPLSSCSHYVGVLKAFGAQHLASVQSSAQEPISMRMFASRADYDDAAASAGIAPSESAEEGESASEVAPGSVWQHKNGHRYTVLTLLNTDSARQDDYPIIVAYRGSNGKTWARKLSDWHRSMKRINPPPEPMVSEFTVEGLRRGADAALNRNDPVICLVLNKIANQLEKAQAECEGLIHDNAKLVEQNASLATEAEASSPPKINVEFYSDNDGIVGTSRPIVMGVLKENDGSWTAQVDYWPPSTSSGVWEKSEENAICCGDGTDAQLVLSGNFLSEEHRAAYLEMALTRMNKIVETELQAWKPTANVILRRSGTEWPDFMAPQRLFTDADILYTK